MSSKADVLHGKGLLHYYFFHLKKKKNWNKNISSLSHSEVYAVSLVIKAQSWLLRQMRLIPSSAANPRDDLGAATWAPIRTGWDFSC